MPKNALLIIDAQYDFCNPQGALYVQGADKDMERLAQFIQNNIFQISQIFLSIDNHTFNDIAHPSFWEDHHKKHPAPFTQITSQDVETGKWKARFEPEKSLEYLKKLEKEGKYLHFIWNPHCLVGSLGASIDEKVMQATLTWSKTTGKDYIAFYKGLHPYSEHFGIFAAQIPDVHVAETQLNKNLINQLLEYEKVYVAGEAKSHCVATSIQQAIDFAPELVQKMVIIEDCMSDVTGLGYLGEPTYKQAKALGISFVSSKTMI
ncbi:MAG: nicotinamidase [Raineya sp.]|jgi:nicotinamidase-related amidase|nr:nicotinamidase [Raineya sp.]